MADTGYRIGDLALSARERKPAGRPRGIILALHGGGYGAGYWDFPPTSLLDVAAERGHLGVAIDRPGYGAAFDRPMPLAEQAGVILDLAEMLRAREGGVPLLLAGHSMGGILALVAAALPRAAESVTAIDACGVPLRYADAMQAALDARRLGAGETHFPALGDAQARHAFFGAGDAPRDLPARMRAITLPVRLTFAAAEASSIASAEVAATARGQWIASPRSVVRFEPDTGHNISLHHVGRAFHHAMIDWLEDSTA